MKPESKPPLPTPAGHDAAPALAPPGAGLPAFELRAARMLFHASRLFSSPAGSSARLARTRDAMLRLACSCPESEASRRVLIPRLRGMEDSSRYWSVFMTVEHVAIVNTGVAAIMRELVAGRVPRRAVSTAEVKPPVDAGPAALARLEQACVLVEEAAAAAKMGSSSLRHPHPWFGPLGGQGWHFLAGFHARLHQRQINQILAALSAAGRQPAPASFRARSG